MDVCFQSMGLLSYSAAIKRHFAGVGIVVSVHNLGEKRIPATISSRCGSGSAYILIKAQMEGEAGLWGCTESTRQQLHSPFHLRLSASFFGQII